MAPSSRSNRRKSSEQKTFAEYLTAEVDQEGGRPLAQSVRRTAPLVGMAYADELALKNKALAAFWKIHGLPKRPEPIIAAPRPRGYRATSNRRTVWRGNTLVLTFGAAGRLKERKAFYPSPLEPHAHARLYSLLRETLSEPTMKPLAVHCNYLIIRGGYRKQALIVNVDALNGPLVRKLKQLAARLRRRPEAPAAMFAYLDPTGSTYYLESQRPNVPVAGKRLYGPDYLTLEGAGISYRYPPTVFSQVNEAMVPIMLQATAGLVGESGGRLADLYCGYGLLGQYLGRQWQSVLGVDYQGPAIQAGRANARRLGLHNIRFTASKLTGGSVAQLLKDGPPPDTVILDPPRQGPQGGVIPAISQARPAAVLHIFCGVDQIPISLEQWRKTGYRVQRIVALDMFAGTANLEVLILLRPSRGQKRRR